MSDTVELGLLGENVKRLQADVRDLRTTVEHIGSTLPVQFNAALLQLNVSLTSRFADLLIEEVTKINVRLDRMDGRFDRLETMLAAIAAGRPLP